MDLNGREILVAEDVRFTRVTLVKMLLQMGAAKVYEAEDGNVALALLAEHGAKLDCLLTDLEMPNVDGLQLLQAVRVGIAQVARMLKVVALTGHSEIDRLGSALLLDVDAIITKPTSKRALEHCFKRLFAPERISIDAGADTYGAVRLSLTAAGPIATDILSSEDHARRERLVPLSAVPANSRLARDLLFQNGRLLLRAGTPLSHRRIAQLQDLVAVAGLPDDVFIVDES